MLVGDSGVKPLIFAMSKQRLIDRLIAHDDWWRLAVTIRSLLAASETCRPRSLNPRMELVDQHGTAPCLPHCKCDVLPSITTGPYMCCYRLPELQHLRRNRTFTDPQWAVLPLHHRMTTWPSPLVRRPTSGSNMLETGSPSGNRTPSCRCVKPMPSQLAHGPCEIGAVSGNQTRIPTLAMLDNNHYTMTA